MIQISIALDFNHGNLYFFLFLGVLCHHYKRTQYLIFLCFLLNLFCLSLKELKQIDTKNTCLSGTKDMNV